MHTFLGVEVLAHLEATWPQMVEALRADPMGWHCFHGIEAVQVASVRDNHRIAEGEVRAVDRKVQVALACHLVVKREGV